MDKDYLYSEDDEDDEELELNQMEVSRLFPAPLPLACLLTRLNPDRTAGHFRVAPSPPVSP